MKGKSLLLIAAFLVLLPWAAFASGPSVFEMGSKASAQAGAFAARADDSTAIFYNPAGIAFLDGQEFSFNMTYLKVDGQYRSPTLGTHDDRAENFFVPSAFYSARISDRLAFGFGMTPHYNLTTDWADNFPGRFASRHAELITITVRPVLAIRLDDHNAIALGIDYHDASINLTRALDTTLFSTNAANGFINPYAVVTSEGTIDTHLRDQALGWNIAYLGKWDAWSFGLTYKSKAGFDFEGHSSFETSPRIGPHAQAFAGTDVNLELDAVPSGAMMGIGWQQDPWTVEFDVQWTEWSRWDRAWARFDRHTGSTVMVPVSPTMIVPVEAPVVEDEQFIFDWDDTFCYRLGFGYRLSDTYELRWGILFDEAPVPDRTSSPVLPDQDRWSIQFGTGYESGNLGIDWYIMYLDSKTGHISGDNLYRYNDNGLYAYPMTPDGRYEFTTWLAGFQLKYKF